MSDPLPDDVFREPRPTGETPEQIRKRCKAAIAEALVEYAATHADEGEPEAVTNAFVIFETSGWIKDGRRFDRQSFFQPEEYLAGRTSDMGLLAIVVPRIEESILGCSPGCDCEDE